MPKEKFQLSETIKFLSSKLNQIAGGELELTIELAQQRVSPGDHLDARVRLRSPHQSHTIEYIVIAMRGQIQRDDQWRDYTESAEIAQQAQVIEGHEIVVPVVLFIPEDAVLSEDGADWVLSAKAVLDRRIDPRNEQAFEVAIAAEREGEDAPEQEEI